MARPLLEELPAEVVHLRDVETVLARLLQSTDDLIPGPIHRARMSNLAIFCDSAERVAQIEAMIPEVIEFHPARVILMVAIPGADSGGLSTSVLVRRNAANHRQVSEQVTLRAGGRSVEHLPFALRELLIGDLPTNLWWATRTPPALAGPMLYELAEYAQQVLFDSHEWLEPHRGIATLDAWLNKFDRVDEIQSRWRTSSDLNWRRTRLWRRIIAEGLAPATAPGALDAISQVEIEHGPHAVTQAWGLVGWLVGRLRWTLRSHRTKPGEEIDFHLTSHANRDIELRMIRKPDCASTIQRVRIACAPGSSSGSFTFAADCEARIAVTNEGHPGSARTVSLGVQDPAEVVGRQLSDRVPDPIFREAMHYAHKLAHGITV